MELLEFSQILFNFVISFAVIIITILISVIATDIINLLAAVKKFTDNVSKGSAEIYEKINDFLENIFKFSFLTKIIKGMKKKVKK